MTLREYISFWQEAYDRHQSRATTYAAHNYVFKNHILPGLGDIPLSELTSEMVGEFLEERRRFGNHRPGSSGLGEETMRHIHRLLQQCLDQAIRDGLITENPAKSFHYRKSTTVKADIMTPLEMEDYLDAAEQLGYLPMFMLALTTGIRQGELIALKWSDLDMKKRTLTIAEKRAVERRELVEYGSQTRSIRLTPEVVDLLIMEHSKHPSSPLMFMHPATLKPYSPQMVRRMHKEIIREAGIDHIRFTDLRHTCAILALKNGMDAKEKGWGRIINMSSIHGLVASEFKSAYVSAKHGLVGFTKTAAMEGGPQGITCNAICPAYVMTPLVEKQIAAQAQTHGIPEEKVISDIMLSKAAIKKMVPAENIGTIVKFLCSDAAASITGIALPIDGGWTAN